MSLKLSTNMVRIKDSTYRIYDLRQHKLEHGNAYIISDFNDYVYPYRGIINDIKEANEPGIYSIGKDHIIIRPTTKDDRRIYSVTRIFEITPDSIFDKLIDDIKEIDIREMDESQLFKPEIQAGDDIAMACVKYLIGKKGIEFSMYHDLFDTPVRRNNMRSLLSGKQGGKTLKMDMAERTGEIFGFNTGFMCYDQKNVPYPADKSNDDITTIYYLSNDTKLDLNSPDIRFERIDTNYTNTPDRGDADND